MKGSTSRTERGQHKPRSISGVIARSMRTLGLARQYDGWQVVDQWPEIVGEAVAERAEALRYDDGTLFVAVPDDVWRQQLSMEIESILMRVQAQPYGRAVQRIRLLHGRKDMKDK